MYHWKFSSQSVNHLRRWSKSGPGWWTKY